MASRIDWKGQLVRLTFDAEQFLFLAEDDQAQSSSPCNPTI